jgi:hypothetical protein
VVGGPHDSVRHIGAITAGPTALIDSQHLDVHQRCERRHARDAESVVKTCRRDPGDVRPVARQVPGRVGGREVRRRDHLAGEVRVARVDSGVDDGDPHSLGAVSPRPGSGGIDVCSVDRRAAAWRLANPGSVVEVPLVAEARVVGDRAVRRRRTVSADRALDRVGLYRHHARERSQPARRPPSGRAPHPNGDHRQVHQRADNRHARSGSDSPKDVGPSPRLHGDQQLVRDRARDRWHVTVDNPARCCGLAFKRRMAKCQRPRPVREVGGDRGGSAERPRSRDHRHDADVLPCVQCQATPTGSSESHDNRQRPGSRVVTS